MTSNLDSESRFMRSNWSAWRFSMKILKNGGSSYAPPCFKKSFSYNEMFFMWFGSLSIYFLFPILIGGFIGVSARTDSRLWGYIWFEYYYWTTTELARACLEGLVPWDVLGALNVVDFSIIIVFSSFMESRFLVETFSLRIVAYNGFCCLNLIA